MLIFDSAADEERYNRLFKYNLAEGYLTKNHNNRPMIILDLSKEFGIPEDKSEFRTVILDNIISQTDTSPYIVSVYKEPITKRCNFEKDEEAFNMLVKNIDELMYVIQNYYINCNEIILCCMGKYNEYNYIYNGLITQLRYANSSVNIKMLNIRHISTYIKNNTKKVNLKSVTILEDILKINRALDEN